MEIRNIAIIAHVDHGKTTLTDAILWQTGAADSEVSMDSNTLEKERGITIYSKNAAVLYKDTKINIVDTPGHVDFGSEVERVLRSIDSVLLVVDAQEGPMPQTRFVLQKSLELGLRPILVINKIDKLAANPDRVHNKVFELFAELGATDEQLDFPVVYAIARDGIAKRNLADETKDITPVLDIIIEHVPVASKDSDEPFRAQPFNLAYDNFLGRLAIVRVYSGSVNVGDTVYVKKHSGQTTSHKATKLFTFEGVVRKDVQTVEAGDIAIIAGLPDVYIGDTLAKSADEALLESISVDEPTIELTFLVNDSPFAGREGKFVTSRQLRERLEKELEVNVGLKIDFDTRLTERFVVYGRGELHIAILIENMRREGYELQVSQPQVIIKEIDGNKHEPFEEIIADVPEEFQGTVIEKLNSRGAKLVHMEMQKGRSFMQFEGPSRGLFGYRNQFAIDTKGNGILASRVVGYRPYAGEIAHRKVGSMISGVTGKALAYALDNLQTRGTLYIKANTEVYEGMVIGNIAKGEQMTVNPIKGKHLTNVRAAASDDAIKLTHPRIITIETGLEIMDKDEYLEVTPKSVRLRKKYLTEIDRTRAKRENKNLSLRSRTLIR
ncbi:MAG TPA: translational GTPase TypA [Candidatus Nealsonbacteria bacterium]|uniref:Tr-type G domain-containing protein n=1 Tax=marine sediment metagenome TaxID=412755 RepID=A0A0F9UN54_9ZZZZ|nr:translational GTPase TypA [Candidatus Nealsonbacteria bacterium]HEB46209.1 translational GTPase TypA [Candidatus Nealsonbacteria bacterium]